jgi:hypothetical protein
MQKGLVNQVVQAFVMFCENAETPPNVSLRFERSGAAPIYFHYHVPKCAGRTIDRHLASVLPSATYYRTKKRRGLSKALQPRHNLADMPAPGNVQVIGGHFLGISIESLFAERPVRRAVLLRDPATHLVSYYNFRMMRYMSQGLQPYSFDVAYGATERNFVTHYILRNFLELSWCRIANLSDGDKYDLVNAFLATFWYVGDYRLCDDLIAAFGETLPVSAEATPRNTCMEWECRTEWRSLSLDDLPASRLAQIRQENMLDQKLWETWHGARRDTGTVRPLALTRQASRGLVSREAVRFINQIARRIKRQWGDPEGLPLPAQPALAAQ